MNDILAAKKENLQDFFSVSQAKPFLIPEYQRPYEWQIDEITALFNDLKAFSDNETANPPADPKSGMNTYFLGTVVFFENPDLKREIVDGQQRIVSLFLLFRAIYEILETDPNFSSLPGMLDSFKKMLWETDPFTGELISQDHILISSHAISDSEHQIFEQILSSGTTDSERRDNYSMNYRTLQSLLKNLASDVNEFKNFVLRVLKQTIILPIEATNFEATLEIFERINDRGRQLTDADIFKAKIYTSIPADMRYSFVESWKYLDERAGAMDVSMRDLFTYLLYYLRAMDGDGNALGNVGLRKYFLYKSNQLKSLEIMMQLEDVINFIGVLKARRIIDGASWSRNFEIKKSIDLLVNAPSDWWQYPALVYYLAHHESPNFEDEYLQFLHKLIATLSMCAAANYTINEIKKFVMNLNINVIHSSHPAFVEKFYPDLSTFETKIDSKKLHSNIRTSTRSTKFFLLLLAYDDPNLKSLMNPKFEIEYIYPKSSSKKNPMTPDVKKKVDELGNLLPIAKKITFSATDKFFDRKKPLYHGIPMQMFRQISEHETWTFDDITMRTQEMLDQLKSIWKRWNMLYDVPSNPPSN